MDLQLPLSGFASVDGRSITLHAADGGAPRLACATLSAVPSREVEAVFSMNGVSGTVTLSQEYATGPTTVTLALDGLDSAAGGYHVHDLPVPMATPGEEGLCGLTGGHFNPFSKP